MNTTPKLESPAGESLPVRPPEEVAESFECPICGLGKDAFEEA